MSQAASHHQAATPTHGMRWLAMSQAAVVILRSHRRRRAAGITSWRTCADFITYTRGRKLSVGTDAGSIPPVCAWHLETYGRRFGCACCVVTSVAATSQRTSTPESISAKLAIP